MISGSACLPNGRKSSCEPYAWGGPWATLSFGSSTGTTRHSCRHARQPPPSLPPAGDGGEGELALIDAVRFFGDKYILFHGITTMFRLGDASLADLTTHRIVGIGELKTTRIDEKTLNMHFQASVQQGVSFN